MKIVKDLQDDIDRASAHLAQLRDEQSKLNALVAQAAEAGDDVGLIKLQIRSDDLPKHLFAAEVRLLRLRIEEKEGQLPFLAEERNHLAEKHAAAIEVRKAAEAAESLAFRAFEAVHQEHASLRADAAREKRELSDKVSRQSRSLAPVVRSLPHMPPAA